MAAFPTTVGIQGMTMRLRSAVAMSSSPFSYDQQVYQHPGVRWEAEVSLPPMTRAQAKEYEAFFASLRGMATTFTMGNPLHNTTATGTISSGAIGATTVTASTTAGVVAGDYFEVNDRLYMVTERTSGSSIKIMPPLRDVISIGTTMDFTLPVGTWRLASNDVGWSINEASIYGFSFACMEAL